VNNRGGNSQVIFTRSLRQIQRLYLRHGIYSEYYGDYTLTVELTTTAGSNLPTLDAVRNTKWVEGSQYVKFSDVKVALGKGRDSHSTGEQLHFLTAHFCRCYDCGLQLIPADALERRSSNATR